jgi:hypothetical protein
VVHDVAVQPGRARLLRSYADEIRVHAFLPLLIL